MAGPLQESTRGFPSLEQLRCCHQLAGAVYLEKALALQAMAEGNDRQPVPLSSVCHLHPVFAIYLVQNPLHDHAVSWPRLPWVFVVRTLCFSACEYTQPPRTNDQPFGPMGAAVFCAGFRLQNSPVQCVTVASIFHRLMVSTSFVQQRKKR